jgi:CBS domain-containing protein
MSVPGMPAGGFKTVGQIDGTDLALFRVDQDAMAIALELLSTHAAGGPVVDNQGKIVGFVSEIDLLDAVQTGKKLEQLQAQDIMAKNPVIVQGSTTVAEAFTLMKENHLVDLPVEQDGNVSYSVSRHDLLRASVGLGPES